MSRPRGGGACWSALVLCLTANDPDSQLARDLSTQLTTHQVSRHLTSDWIEAVFHLLPVDGFVVVRFA